MRKSQSQSPGVDDVINSKPRDKNYQITTREKNLLQSKELVKEGEKKEENIYYLLTGSYPMH